MHARTACLVAALSLATITPATADDAQTTLRAAITPSGQEVRLVTTTGGKSPGATLRIGKAAAISLHQGEAVGTVKAGHGRVVVAYMIDDANEPFRIHVPGDAERKPAKIARPAKRHDVPFAIALTPTPSGFTVFFQEVEAADHNEAHTYMLALDKDGNPDGAAREVQIPWWIGDAAWNGSGYHLALFYAGDMNGVRLSMVSLDDKGTPQQHPDWASKAGLVSDVHLVARGKTIRAYYRGGMGDRLLEADVTKIRQWGTEPPKAKDHGGLAATSAIAITPKGALVRVKR